MIAARLDNGIKKYQCDVCGKVKFWGESWSWYGSLAEEETCPDLIPHLCSDKCRTIAEKKIKKHEWRLPVVKLRGGFSRVINENMGYGKALKGSNLTKEV